MSVVVPVRVPREIAEKIRRLVESGVFPNRSSLVREALRRLVVSEGSKLWRGIRGKAIATLASLLIAWNEKSVSDVILFGSVARGEETAGSDVDLLVLVEDAEAWVVRRRLYDLIYPIIPAFGVDVSLIVIEKKRFLEMLDSEDPFAFSVLQEGVQLRGGLLLELGEGSYGKGC
jgi:Arc/MetJ-type ribon-helix-helix transcriptional regulator